MFLSAALRLATISLLLLVLPGAISAQGKGGNGDEAYTMWLVIFNSPENCVDENGDLGGPCDGDDVVPGTAAETEVAWLGGTRVQSNGRMALAGSYAEGSTLGGLFGPGLIDADAAEVHVVLQTHGAVQADSADFLTQITEVFGACNPDCADTHFAIFPPGAGSLTVDVQRFDDGSAVAGARADITRTNNGDAGDGIVVSAIADVN